MSLYLPEPGARAIEAVRLVLDPVQHRLIPAHVTLCREGELAQVDRRSLATRLAAFPAGALTLGFGMPEPFHEHGILLPCIAGEEEFRELRQHVLGSRRIRHQAPHITLAHPRNPRAAGNCLANARTLPGKLEIVLASANLIEQAGASAWRVLDTIAFGAA